MHETRLDAKTFVKIVVLGLERNSPPSESEKKAIVANELSNELILFRIPQQQNRASTSPAIQTIARIELG